MITPIESFLAGYALGMITMVILGVIWKRR